MLTHRGRLCWCVVFPADHWQAWMVWSKKGGPQSWTSSEPVRKIGSSFQRKPVLFMSEGSHVHSCFVLSSLLWADKFSSCYFFFFPGCSAWFVGTWLPEQGLNPGPQQWKQWVLTTGLPGNSHSLLLKIILYFGKKHSFSCSRLIGIIAVRTTLIAHWVVHHRFIHHLIEHSKRAYVIINVLVTCPPFSQ